MQKRRTIVAVVDDDPSMLKAAEDLLDAHGCTASLFTSAEEFLASELVTRADCLLLDIHLGGLSGIELRRQLKSSRPALPVIFMTALDDEAMGKHFRPAALPACASRFRHASYSTPSRKPFTRDVWRAHSRDTTRRIVAGLTFP